MNLASIIPDVLIWLGIGGVILCALLYDREFTRNRGR